MDIIIANIKPEYDISALGILPETLKRMEHQQSFPIGLGIIAAVLKENNIDFRGYDSYVNGSLAEFLNIVENDKPDIIMLSGFVGNFNYTFLKNVASKIKEISASTITIIGGPIASTIPEIISRNMAFDYIVVGEGEVTIMELLDAIRTNGDVSKVKGIFLGQHRGGFFTGDRERLPVLKVWPYYEVFPVDKYVGFLEKTQRCWEVSTSRGCWNHCTFCKITFGQRISRYSTEDIVGHFMDIAQRYGVNRFSMVDDNFLNNKKKVEELCALLRDQPVSIKWRAQGRADNMSLELVKKMMSVGFYDLVFGLESGNQDMLNRYRKNLDLKKATQNLLSLREVIPFRANFIIGGPGENWDTIKDTERLVRTLQLKHATFTYMTLYPGTVLYDQAIQDGIIVNEEEYLSSLGPTFYQRPYVNISDLSNDELVKARDHLYGVAAEYEDCD